MSEAKTAIPFAASSPDPEVPAKAQRRKFSAEDKKRILEDVERATGHGGIGAVLRREGIYSSTLYGWRKERDAAVHKAFLRSEVRGHSAIRWPGKTRSCDVRISVCRRNWRKPTSSSTFKKTFGRGRSVHLLDQKLRCRYLGASGEMAAHFLVFCEPVKKHGLGVARGLESGDVVRRSRLGN